MRNDGHHGDDDAGRTSAIKSKINQWSHRIKRWPHTRQVVIIHIAIGAVLVLVALGGQTLANDGDRNETVCPWRAWIKELFTDGDDGEHTKGAAPFQVVKVKPSMMIWSMLCAMQRNGDIRQQSRKRWSR